MNYTMRAYPTVYRGRTYRSRLEARWAAFLDKLNLAHEYEPFDLGQWSPDFLLPDWHVLIEVKPVTDFDEETWQKMIAACRRAGLTEEKGNSPPLQGLLLLGAAPFKWKRGVPTFATSIGWLGTFDNDYEPEETFITWRPGADYPHLVPDLVHQRGYDDWWLSVRGGGGCEDWVFGATYGDYALDLWAQATSLVQWNPAEAPT